MTFEPRRLLGAERKVRKGLTARRAGLGLWVEGSGSLDFFGYFLYQDKTA
ncbi:hypothetical protein [Mucilaginibacter paludis]|nr:hypothetical protein [Mucilaginibacter paludis]